MIDWSFPPDIQAQYDRVLAQTRKLQKELGITPMTLEQRAQAYHKRKAQEEQYRKQLEEYQSLIGQKRPLVKWKI